MPITTIDTDIKKVTQQTKIASATPLHQLADTFLQFLYRNEKNSLKLHIFFTKTWNNIYLYNTIRTFHF